MSHKIEDYLGRVARELRHLPASVREDELREMRSHLEQMIEDGQVEGQNPVAATQSALAHFGDARAVGIRVRDVWEGQVLSYRRVLVALICGSTFWVGATYALVFFAFKLSFWRGAALFPEMQAVITAVAALIPFLTGMVFAAWLGRRGWILSALFLGISTALFNWIFLASTALLVALHLPHINFQTSLLPSTMAWEIGLGVAGALLGNWILGRYRYANSRLAAWSAAGQEQTAAVFSLSLRKKRFLSVSAALVSGLVALALAFWRVETTLHPRTPAAALRVQILTPDLNRNRYLAPKIRELRELPPQSPAERERRECRVAFRIELRATDDYVAARTAYLKSRILSKTERTAWGEAALRASLKRVRANAYPIGGVAKVVKTPMGWRVDEKSFNESRLRGWIEDVYHSD